MKYRKYKGRRDNHNKPGQRTQRTTIEHTTASKKDYQWVQKDLLFQPVPEVQQNQEALVVPLAQEDPCL